MNRDTIRLFKGSVPILIFTLAIILFASQMRKSISTVNFHAELFKAKETVVIDPGHGGEDGGAVGVNNILEKDINLAIALKLRDMLVRDNYEVILVRDGDYSVGDSSLTTVSQRKRSDTKNRLQMVVETGECIYIGIHQNYFTQSKYSGAQIFYSGNRQESTVLAESIRGSIVSQTQSENKRECKQAGNDIYILDNCQVPAVFVECGFISNPEEGQLLVTEQYQTQIAKAIAQGLSDYIAQISQRPQVTNSAQIANWGQ